MRPLLLCALWLPLAVTGAEQPVPVTVRPLSALAVYPSIEAPATVVSRNSSRLSAEVTARIVAIPVQVGDAVAAGAVLARLDCADYTLAVARARAVLDGYEARLRLARYRLQRAETLARSGSVSAELRLQREVELGELEADIEAAKATLATARRNIERCAVRAPYEAVVVARIGQVGELAAPGTPLVQVEELAGAEVSAQVQPQWVGSLERAVAIAFQDEGEPLPLRLRTVLPVRDARARTQEVRLVFSATRAPAGSAGRLIWRRTTPHLPADLLERREGRLGFFTLLEGAARFHPLESAQEGRPAAVGLSADTAVIVDGRVNLRDNTPVRVEP